MPMSFREKSQWIVIAALVAVYGAYFVAALPAAGRDVAPADMGRFVLAVLALVLVQAAGHALLAIAARRELARGVQRDERDAWIDLRGTRVGAHVLAVGVFAALCTALWVPGNFAFMHVLLAFWVASHMAGAATQLVLYRRGG